jgi:hypothetical protein
MKKINLILIVICNLIITIAMANPGNYQINQACLAVGCFSGDDPNTDTVEITKSSGTFVLTSDIHWQNSNNGNPAIRVSSVSNDSMITIDLNGFKIYHSQTASNITDGIEVEGANSIVTIRNGKISGFYDGIVSANGSSLVVENMVFRIMRDDAIVANSGTIRNNVFDSNNYGIFATGTLTGDSESILIDSNIFMGTTGIHEPTASVSNTSLCSNNVIEFTSTNQLGTCSFTGFNLCNGSSCVVVNKTTIKDKE